MAYRDNTKVVHIGNKVIGGGNPIMIQSMTNTPTENVEATVNQILALEKAGCDIVRCTVPNQEAADAITWMTVSRAKTFYRPVKIFDRLMFLKPIFNANLKPRTSLMTVFLNLNTRSCLRVI